MAHGSVLHSHPYQNSILNLQSFTRRLSVENGAHSILSASVEVRSQRWGEVRRRRVVCAFEDRIEDSLPGAHSILRVRGQTWGEKERKRGRVVCAFGDRIEDSLPTQEDIVAAAREKGLLVAIKATGPLFVVTAIDVATGENLGTADGFIKPWVDTNVLHLDSIRLTKASATRSGRTIFGAAMYMGALMVRHGIDCACDRGELLAINDSDEYHRKLVRYYSRLGWKVVYEVKGDSWRDYLHMLVWGGVGTRMDADLRELLGKWAATLTPESKATALVES